MSITEVLEKIGQQSNLNYSAEVDSRKLLTEMFVPSVIQKALITKDQELLLEYLGVKQDIICYVSVPHKDRETPKDDNQPEPEDLPYPEESAYSLVG